MAGHTLIVTKHHVPSFSGVSTAFGEELRRVVAGVKALVAIRHQAPFLFEHGPGDGPYSGCCVCHAHIHVVPLDPPVTAWLRTAIDGDLQRGHGDVMATLSAVRSSSYLYYQSPSGEDFVLSGLESPVPRQFLRQAVGRFLNIRDWNWKSSLSHAYARDRQNVG